MKYGTKNKVHERRAAFLFILPAVVLLAAFLILPAVSTVRYAFTDYNILRPDKIKFCGLDNFVELFGDRDFKKSLVNTIYFTVVVVPFQCILALLLAMLISSRRKGVSIFRAAYFSPNITSMVVVAILWSVLCPLRFPDRSQDVHEFHYLYVGLAGGRVSDDDFPGRTSGHTGRPV